MKETYWRRGDVFQSFHEFYVSMVFGVSTQLCLLEKKTGISVWVFKSKTLIFPLHFPLFYSGSPFSVAVTPAQSNIAPGDSVFLRCSHTSTDRGASYTWERLDGMDMMATGRFEAGGRSGEVLLLTFAEEADSGVYVCRVTSSQGVQTGTAQVFVGEA